MRSESGQRISLREAARLIYRVQQPTPEQIERVRMHIDNRELAGDRQGTTTTSVADFLARTATARQRATRPDHAASHREADELDRVYHEGLKNFFLAVIFQRKLQGTSVRFQRAVVAGQIGLLVMTLALVAFSARTAFPPLSPERAAVLTWLKANEKKPRIIQWHSPAVDGHGRVRMRVQYHYVTPLGKGVDTDRMFIIQNGQVVGMETDW